MNKNSKNKRIFEVLWTVDAVLRFLESHHCILRWIKLIGEVIFTKKKKKISQMGTPTLENPGNRWKKPGFPGIPGKFSSL
jgi:hypothetical protein